MPVIVTTAPRPGDLAGAVYPLLATQLEQTGEPRVTFHDVIDAPYPTLTTAGPATDSGFVEFLCADRTDALALHGLLKTGDARITDDTVTPGVDLTVRASQVAVRPTQTTRWTVEAQWRVIEP